MAPPFHLKRKKESLWCPAQAASALLRENLCQQWPLERTNWYLWHQPVLPKTKVANLCESPEISSTEKCYFSRFLTSREHSKTQADVFKFKHTTPVTAKVQAAQNRKVSHLLSNNFVREKRLTDSISSLVFRSMALGLRSPHPDINFFLPLNNTKVIISW